MGLVRNLSICSINEMNDNKNFFNIRENVKLIYENNNMG